MASTDKDKDKFVATVPDDADSRDQGASSDASATAKTNSRPSAVPLSPHLPQRASTFPNLSSTSSTTASPKPSREASPIRPAFKSGSGAASRGSRSRKNSQDLSPNRASSSIIPAVPSAAAIQRALSAAGSPQLQSPVNAEFSLDPTRLQKPGKGIGGGSNQPGSHLPRVRSPPPPASSNKASGYSSRRPDQAPSTPSIVVERSSPVAGTIAGIDDAEEGILVPSGMRTPVRGSSVSGPTLETVQESSDPATPAIGATRIHHGGKAGSDDPPESIAESPLDDAVANETLSKAESGSESGGNKSTGMAKESKEARRPEVVGSAAKPQIVHPKTSFTQLHPAKGKTGSESTVKNMTVETETVSTIPHVALGGGAGERTGVGRPETGGSLRLKPSNETIRPRKEKKKAVRKAPSINSGTGGSISRRFHHHHIYSRPAFSNIISLSTVPPSSSVFPSATPAYAWDHDYVPSARHSSDRRHEHAQDRSLECITSDPAHRSSSALLTSLRGRTASSKADIFEAKVASAVEVNSSDSEETFVYESNPPEPLSRPHRFHSRTPSATSMASQMDQYDSKGRQDRHHSIAGKKSMKFTNNSYHTPGFPGDANNGTVRGSGQSGRPSGGNASHHHHIGRYGRGGHTSLFDNASPFSNPGRPLRTSPSAIRVSGHSRKPSEPMSYDLEGEGADDERTPLIGYVQSRRNRNSRRPIPGALRNNGYSTEEKGQRLCRRVTAFASLGTLLAFLIAAIVIILIMCSKPLYEVHLKDIRNVLASEQALIFDMNVRAVNPNLISVQVSDLNVKIFAKSKHVGGKRLWRWPQSGFDAGSKIPFREGPSRGGFLPQKGSERNYHYNDGVDEGTDPIDDPETDSQTMLLGRISEFDSPLIFDPSPLRRHALSSVGEVQLATPGNTTEADGSERWERVIQHEFELIIRGVLRYSLPITTRTRSVSIGGSVIVYPGEEDELWISTDA
ncbi:hypothetical protein MMC07_007665 [Pseudocyphellaria aurata]|nr:hypothetical protein [Pseudocyphellaria aurata]